MNQISQVCVALIALLIIVGVMMTGVRKRVNWFQLCALVAIATRLGWTLSGYLRP